MSVPIKNVIAYLTALIISVGASGATASGIEKLVWSENPQPATSVSFQNEQGNNVTLADYEGKVLVVNLWATWCAPCIREMPTLDNLEREMGGESLHIIAMSQDREGKSVAQPFMETNEWSNLDLYVAPDLAFAKAAAVKGLPTTLVIDKKGREVARLQGTAEWDSEDIRTILRELITEGN